MFNIRDKEEVANTLKTFMIGGSFIMCLWIGGPFLIHKFIDPCLGKLDTRSFRWIGGPVSLAGYLLAVWCVMLFIKKGKGTPLPFFHPKRLVQAGPYRFVRNPMSIGTVLFLVGSGVLMGSYGIFAYALLVFVVLHLFILVEEKSLTKRFGREYTLYIQKTPRWWPHFQ